MRAIEITTRQYENEHGRPPRGKGQWAFEIVDDSNGQVVSTIFAPPLMTYRDAKVWAKAHVREEWAEELATGYLSLNVGS